MVEEPALYDSLTAAYGWAFVCVDLAGQVGCHNSQHSAGIQLAGVLDAGVLVAGVLVAGVLVAGAADREALLFWRLERWTLKISKRTRFN